ncbi:MAG: LD-carboxypeptidase, partial [Myxococcota bacterium]|nr:LD-carboxypeptidase [Myxococcota bacterium]
IIGLSDATALLLGIYHKTGLVTFYGPALATGFGEFAPLVDVTYACFKDVLAPQGHADYTYIQPKEWTDEMIDWESQVRPKRCQANHVEFAGHGRVSGRLIGGNLNTMWSIWGSPYIPEIKTGDILLIEDSFKHISTVERLFMFLRLNGIFDRVSAIVLGKHEQFDGAGSGRKPITVLQEVLDGLSVPIVSDFDCAHTHPVLTMPIGGQACIDFDAETVTLKAPWTAT